MAGGTAGLFEALCCHPLDTIKVRMQIYRRVAGIEHVKPQDLLKLGVPFIKKKVSWLCIKV